MVKVKFFSGAVLALSLLMLPNCKWFNKQDQDAGSCGSEPQEKVEGAVILSINGKPALTSKGFEDFINRAAEGNEQIKLMMQIMPDLKEQLFTAKKRAMIIGEWAKKEGIRNTKEYCEREKAIIDQIRESLDSEEFLKRHTVDVSDDEAKKYYEENKDKDPRILQSGAGVNAAGVMFANQTGLNEFADSLRKNNGRDLEKLAKAKNLNVVSFGVVNENSSIDSKVKEKLLSAKNLPTVLVVKGDNGKFWVVVAKNKERMQYRPFEQVKEVIVRMLKPRKLEEMLERELPKLEKEFNVIENRSYFEEEKKKAQQEAAKLAQPQAQQAAAMQPAKELSVEKAA